MMTSVLMATITVIPTRAVRTQTEASPVHVAMVTAGMAQRVQVNIEYLGNNSHAKSLIAKGH